MQNRGGVLISAANDSGVFNFVTDNPPLEIAVDKYPAFYRFNLTIPDPVAHSQRIYSGEMDMDCWILSNKSKHSESDALGYLIAFLGALADRSENTAQQFQWNGSSRTFFWQMGQITARILHFRIRSSWGLEL